MTFQAPEWFALLPVLFVTGWLVKRLQLWRPLRVVCLALLVLILAKPQLNRMQKGMDLWLLVDRSDSVSEIVDRQFREWKKLLEKHKPSRHDRLHFVDYAAEVIRADENDLPSYSGKSNLTKTRLALSNVLAGIESEKPARVLALTDGFSTEPLGDVAEKLRDASVPLDFRLVRPEENTDIRISSFGGPARVQAGEPFVLDVELSGNWDTTVPLRILRNGEEMESAEINLVDGSGRIRFSNRIGKPGSYEFEAVITPPDDAFPGNNRYKTWVEIAGGPRILFVTKYTNDPLVEALRGQGFEIDVSLGAEGLTPGRLAGAKTLVLNNVPAYEIPNEFLRGIDFFVRAQGGGFLMIGGKQSFGAGGYYQSVVDELLPVSMELKEEHRMLTVAMAIVMDRSGSMGMTVPGGMTKMQLANEGAARAIELLGNQDLAAVFAVDSQADTIIPLSPVAKVRDSTIHKVRRISAGGGGIFVYTGMVAGWKELEKSPYGTRHLILFSDARDSEEPGKYKSLIDTMTKNGGTVSVIGLGTPKDVDAAFLKDIAKRGNGRIFFTEKAQELPNIFAQETVTIARSTFVEDPAPARATGRWYEIASGNLKWLSEVDGYNLSYLRPKDVSALNSSDEYNAPLVAFGNRGAGRTVAISFPMGGEFSSRIRSWEGYGDFAQTMARWLMGEKVPPGVALRSEVLGTRLDIDLYYDDSWNDAFSKNPPEIILGLGQSAESVRNYTWERLSPGRFHASLEIPEGEVVRGAIQLGKHSLPFGPVIVGTQTEWAFDPDRIADLRETSRLSGGRELVKLDDAWTRPPHQLKADLQLELVLLLFFIFLIEALITRTGWRLPAFDFAGWKARTNVDRQRRKAERESRRATEQFAKSQAEVTTETAKIDATPDAADIKPGAKKVTEEERRSRFARAKRGGK
ncbi:MAG: VWA domain-containing protein [Verrucomicrobiota bacterium]